MASLQGALARLRGDRVDAIARDVAEIRELTLGMNHAVVHESKTRSHALPAIENTLASMNETLGELVALVEAQRTVLLALNHDVRSGADDALPLFLGYAERLRLDTDTAIGAAQVIERQLAVLESLVAPADDTEQA